MSPRFIGACLVGLVGSLFVGYCVYFDRKRRSDPDYKKKVLARGLPSYEYSSHFYAQAMRVSVQGGSRQRSE